MRRFFRRTHEIDIEPRFARGVEQHGNQQNLSVVQGHTKLAAVRPDEDVMDRAISQLPHGFRNTPEILD